MGGKESVPVEIRGHPEMFYKGAEAAKDGRYQTAEFYFHQALQQHEGHDFWVELINRYYGKVPKNRKKRRGDNVSNDSGDLTEKALRSVDSDNDEGESREATDPSSHASNTVGMKLIDLPIDNRIIPILEYLRLMADIVNTYLCHEIDDKNLNLALVHCCYLGLHIQIIYYLLSVWAAENKELLKQLDEDTLFEIDESLNHKKERKGKKHAKGRNGESQSDGSSVEGAGVNGNHNVLASGEQMYPIEDDESSRLKDSPGNGLLVDNVDGISRGHTNANRKKRTWTMGSRDEIPTGTDILMVRKTIFAFVRHHWAATVFNYCSISLLFIEKRCAPTEVKKINLIYQNILGASSSSVWDLQQICGAEKDVNVLAANILKRMPENKGFIFDAEAIKNAGNIDDASGGASGDDSKISSQFFASFTGGTSVSGGGGGGGGAVNSGMQTFLTFSSSFSPIYPLMVDPTRNLPMRFNLLVDTPKSKLCIHKLRPPGSYNLFHYTNWFDVLDVFLIAGYNSRYLNKMIPYYCMQAGFEESSFMSKVKMSNMANGVSNTIVQKTKGNSMQRLAATETENFLDPAMRELMKKNDLTKNQPTVERIKSQKIYFNPLLKKDDPYTIRTVIFEEDIIHALFSLILQTKVFSKLGRGDEAKEWLDFVLFMVEQVYTRESEEYIHTSRIVEMYREM